MNTYFSKSINVSLCRGIGYSSKSISATYLYLYNVKLINFYIKVINI